MSSSSSDDEEDDGAEVELCMEVLLSSSRLPCGRCVPTHLRCCVCGKQGKLRCSKCGIARYCDRQCQRAHWPDHKRVCDKDRTRQRQPPSLHALPQRSGEGRCTYCGFGPARRRCAGCGFAHCGECDAAHYNPISRCATCGKDWCARNCRWTGWCEDCRLSQDGDADDEVGYCDDCRVVAMCKLCGRMRCGRCYPVERYSGAVPGPGWMGPQGPEWPDCVCEACTRSTYVPGEELPMSARPD